MNDFAAGEPQKSGAFGDLSRARKFCAAPMMRHSHAAARRLWRFLCPPAMLYSEMLAADAVIHGRRERLLDFGGQSPVALQLGGRDKNRLAEAARIGEEYGAAEINLNCGCPSPRVRCGGFGASLMKTPARTGAIVAAIANAVDIPVTVKCRIAVDEMNGETGLDVFVRAVLDGGASALILHSRRAFLDGLNPAQNRVAPPLEYDRAARLKESLRDFPVILNGGVCDLDSAKMHLRIFDGVMCGRAIVKRPYFLAEAGAEIFGITAPSRRDALRFMLEDAAHRPPRDWPRAAAALSGLFYGEPDGGHLRRMLYLPLADARRLLRGHC